MNKNILLVEDEAIIALKESEELKEIGYNVIIANNGEKAIDLIFENESIDLVLMDIDLGSGIDGTETAEIILKNKHIPILFLSSHTSLEIINKTEKITSYGYVVKNTGITVLDASIKMAFKLFDANETIIKQKEEYKKAKEIAEINEIKYKTIFEGAPVGIFRSTKNGKFIELNNALTYILGYDTPQQVIDSIYNIAEQIYVFSSKRSEIIDKTSQTVIQKFENIYKRKNGEIFYANLYLREIKDENGNDILEGVVEETTEIKLYEEELKLEKEKAENSEKMYKIFYNNTPVMMQSTDVSGNLLSVNNYWLKIFGYEKTEVLGTKVVNYFTEDSRNLYFSKINELFENGKLHNIEIQAHIKNGRLIDLLVSSNLLYDKYNNPIQVLTFLIDITINKKAEEEVRRQLKEKEFLLKEAYHRIKNNICNIEALFTLKLNTVKDDKVLSIMQESISRIQSMKVLYENLLIEDNYNEVPVENYISSLVSSIYSFFPENKKININFQISDFKLISKKLLLVGIIINELLTNIMKYAFIGRKNGDVQISIDKSDNQVILIVKDNGNGLPDSFNINENTGFGLNLVKILAEQLDGTFKIECNSGVINTLSFPF